MVDYSKEFYNYIVPKGENVFGFWMQTLADLELLKLELEGLTTKFKINPTERTVELEDDIEKIRLRISHSFNSGHTVWAYALVQMLSFALHFICLHTLSDIFLV